MTTLDYALKYASLGWSVLPLYGYRNGRCDCGDTQCKSQGKHPHRDLVPHGVHDASKDPGKIKEWFTRVPNANIGIATGAISGFVVLDVDPRNGSDDTLDALQSEHGKLPDTALQLTGGGGYHYLFKYNGQRLRSPGRGLDVKGDGGYIVAEPSNHASGGAYAWEGSADPTEGHPLADPPEWMLAPVAISTPAVSHVGGTGYLDPQRINDLRTALAYLDPEPYGQWISVGQALHSTEAPEAFDLWDAWSQTAPNYDNSSAAKWRTFKANGPLHVESIFVWARDAGWNGASEFAAVPGNSVTAYVTPDRTTPPHLLTLPGVLGTFVDLCNRTAPKPQPQFAVQAALAFGSVVLGRRYRTTRNNWPGLYFVNIGKSASGKEHARTVIDAVLSDAGLGRLIGPSGYTSDSAVFSSLYHQPAHIAFIDELGELLGNAKAQGNYLKRSSIKALVEVWGLMGGTMRPQGYSTMALRPDQRAEMAERCVHRPSLTLLGMTTPKTFYDSLTESAIEGGFLNRLIIVESTIGRQLSRDADPLDVPDSLVEWCRAVRDGQGGNLSGLDATADQVPVPRVVEFSPEAREVFRRYEQENLAAQDLLEPEGLAEMEGRSVEKALRVSELLAVSDNVTHPVIQVQHAQWAIDYVRYYTAQTIEAVHTHLTGSLFGQWRASVLDSLRRAGARGLTERELARNCRLFAGLDPRQRQAVLSALHSDELAAKVESKGPSGRGRARVAWIALQAEIEDAA